jgi:hypothetical protein
MSQASLNSAKNRRANPNSGGIRPGQNVPTYNPNINGNAKAPAFPPSSPSPLQNTNTNSPVPPAMTLPQVIAYVDKRLCVLEAFMGETKTQLKNEPSKTVSFAPAPAPAQENTSQSMTNNMQEVVDEFDKRYQLLAEEIENLKNIVLSLQSYTMDVNKMLLEDRARIYAQLQEDEIPAEDSQNQINENGNE